MNIFSKKNIKFINPISKITFTGIMLSFVIIFQFTSRYMPLGFGYITLNISLIFIIPIFYLSGIFYGITIFFIRYFLGVLLSSNPGVAGFFSNFSLLAIESIVLFIMFLLFWILEKIQNKYKVITVFSITIFLSSIIISFLNAIFFIPIFWLLMGWIPNYDFDQITTFYNSIKVIYFYIPNYWGGVFATSILGNLIKFSLIFIIFYPLNKIIDKIHKLAIK